MPLKRRTPRPESEDARPDLERPESPSPEGRSQPVATLVSNPELPALTDALLARAAQVLPHVTGPVWLDQGIAADLSFTAHAGADLRAVADQYGSRSTARRSMS